MGLADELTRIYQTNGERLTREMVVEDARPPGSPLHNRFEWDDSVAAEKYRLEQAGHLIRSVRFTVTRSGRKRDLEVRTFHAIPAATSGPMNYVPVEALEGDPVTRAILLATMEREWRTLKRRYDDFVEFWALVREDTPV